jgi:hypothetical protein
MRAKIPTDTAICPSCGDPVYTDGAVVRCANGHESQADSWGGAMRRWLRAFRQWAKG